MTRIQQYVTFAAAILVTGVLSGIAGGFTTLVVKAIEHLVYGYEQGPLLTGVKDASIERRLLGPAIGCALAGMGWWLLRRKATVPNLTEQIRAGSPFEHGPMGIDALLQVLAVGSGASLGREQAPRLFAASFTELWIRHGSIPPAHRQILLGSAAGAGLAAVYNVPAAGVLFALGIILRSWRPLAVLVAVATSCIATVTVWPISHGAPTFLWPETHFTSKAFLFALIAMPMAALIGTAFNGGDASVPTLGLIGGAAVLAITQNAPVFAAVFTAELTHPPLEVWVFLLVAAIGAHSVRAAVTRRRVARTPAEH